MMREQEFFHPGKNCWRTERADRIAFLVDGETYFGVLADALEQAGRSIFIIGWDIDSRIRLRRPSGNGDGEQFDTFLDRLARSRPGLHIYLLEWDFAMLYALEREFLPALTFGWQTHHRIHFELDPCHPVGASHHQKIVVIDDCLAFVGGFDLACSRWDTSEHRPDEPRRCDNGTAYGPFHDVQMMVDGEVARALGELARRRWQIATGTELDPPGKQSGDPWPAAVEPDLRDAPVAILRTEPEYDGRPAVQEIRQFYLDAIEGARSYIYIENQYLTAHDLGDALAAALSREAGPEVVIVLPRTCSGWLEQGTMGSLRTRLVRQLRSADLHGRLRLYFPHRSNLDEQIINVHSKVLIVDDRLLRIGSSNLSNRSLGFDTECDLALAADDREDAPPTIRRLRDRLLGEHLATDPDAVAEQVANCGSLTRAIENLRGNDRTLMELPPEEPDEFGELLSESQLADPERPISPERLLELFNLDAALASAPKRSFRGLAFFLLLLVTLALTAAWRWTALGEWLALDRLLELAETVRSHPLAAPLVLGVFVVGSLMMVPVTLMILATALSFGPVSGFFLALGGSLLGGLAGFGAGRLLGREAIQRLGGDRVNRLNRRLAKRGWLAMALLRVVPVAPYTVVNLMAGATHISWRDFLFGTAAGMGPGILAIMLFEGGLERAIRDPGAGSAAMALAALAAGGLLLWGGRRWLQGQEESENG